MKGRSIYSSNHARKRALAYLWRSARHLVSNTHKPNDISYCGALTIKKNRSREQTIRYKGNETYPKIIDIRPLIEHTTNSTDTR